VSNIVSEFTELLVLRADIGIEGWSNGSDLEIIPVGVSVRATGVVSSDDVVWVGDPDGGRGLIGVKERPGATDIEDQVILNEVLALNGIFNEDSVTHSVIGNVVLDTEVVNAVNGDSSVERVMDSVVTHVRLVDSSNHMEMNGVRSKDESLTDHGQLNGVNTALSGLITR